MLCIGKTTRDSDLNLTHMDYIRGAIANALADGLDLADVWAMAEHAETPEAFDRAVNDLIYATPAQGGMAFMDGQWVELN